MVDEKMYDDWLACYHEYHKRSAEELRNRAQEAKEREYSIEEVLAKISGRK